MDVKLMFSKAIDRLLESRRIEDITISDITRESGLSKSCFYTHFTDKYDLVNWSHTKVHERNMSGMLQGSKSYRQMVRKSLEDIGERQHVYAHALGSDDYETLRSRMRRLASEAMRDMLAARGVNPIDRDTAILLEMHAEAACDAMFKWICRDLTLTADELAGLIERALPSELARILSSSAEVDGNSS